MGFLRSIARKVVNVFRAPVRPAYLDLVERGYLKVGKDCNLDGANFVLVCQEPGTTYIEIGDKCCIRGTLMLYRQSSRIFIGNNVYIGPGTLLECVEEIRMGNDILVSLNCNIIDTNSHSLHSAERLEDTIDWQKGLAFKNWDVVKSKKVIIEDKCWIGLRSIVMKGVTLGEGTVVGAGSVITKNTEPFSIMAGNPAVLVRKGD